MRLSCSWWRPHCCGPERQPWRAGALAVVLGVAFTAASEWYNVYVLGFWAYAAKMPLLGGIRLAPLFQWVMVPALMIPSVRRLDPRPPPAPKPCQI